MEKCRTCAHGSNSVLLPPCSDCYKDGVYTRYTITEEDLFAGAVLLHAITGKKEYSNYISQTIQQIASANTDQPKFPVMYSVDGLKKGRIINFSSRRCSLEGCRGNLISVRWEDGKLTLPCNTMVKQISSHEYQICHTIQQLKSTGLNRPADAEEV